MQAEIIEDGFTETEQEDVNQWFTQDKAEIEFGGDLVQAVKDVSNYE